MADISRGRHPLRGQRAANKQHVVAAGNERMTVLCDVIVAETFTVQQAIVELRAKHESDSILFTSCRSHRGATSIRAAARRRLFSADYVRKVGDTRTHAPLARRRSRAAVMPYLTTAAGSGFAGRGRAIYDVPRLRRTTSRGHSTEYRHHWFGFFKRPICRCIS